MKYKGFFFIYSEEKWHRVSHKVFRKYKGSKAFTIKFGMVYIYSDLNIIVDSLDWKTFKRDFLEIPELTQEEKIAKLQEQLIYLASVKAN